MKYAVLIEQGPTSFGASVPDLPGCIAVAPTREEVERRIEEAIAGHIAVLRELGRPVPAPVTQATTIEVQTGA
jgi:predicted RNase H-like HicB family nuclease